MSKKEKIVNYYYYDEIINYLEKSYNDYNFDNSLRETYIKEFLTKYIRIVKSIKLLDLNGFHHECDILIRSLDEMIIDLGYLELNPDDNYIRYDLFVNYQLYDLIKEKCEFENTDINSYQDIADIKSKHDQYEKQYNGKRSRWSGISYYNQAEEIDNIGLKGTMKFTDMFRLIYRLNCLNSHNSGIVLDKVYKNLEINEKIDYMYLHNINYIVLLTSLLKDVCLPQVFTKTTTIFKQFDNFLGFLNLLKKLSSEIEEN